MWIEVPGFPDYLLNDKGSIYRKSTEQLFPYKRSFAFKDASGQWKNRSIAKLMTELHGVYTETVITATPIQDNEEVQTFGTIKEAAMWLIEHNKAITAGKLAAYSTIRTNISLGITHPTLYPYMYGYKWTIENKE